MYVLKNERKTCDLGDCHDEHCYSPQDGVESSRPAPVATHPWLQRPVAVDGILQRLCQPQTTSITSCVGANGAIYDLTATMLESMSMCRPCATTVFLPTEQCYPPAAVPTELLTDPTENPGPVALRELGVLPLAADGLGMA